jgi:putative membrane protein
MITATAGSLRRVVLRTAGVIAGFALLAPVWGDALATKFLTDAIRSNIAEVRISELAQQRGKSKDVRDYSAALVADHTMALQRTSALAKTLGVTPPTESTADAIKTREAMSKLSGEDFDRAFVSHMVMGHEQSIAKYTEASRDGSNPDVAELAKDMLPTLQRHLATAQSIDKSLNAD